MIEDPPRDFAEERRKEDDARAGIHWVECSHCRKLLYRVRGSAVLNRSPDDDYSMPLLAINTIWEGRFSHCHCSKACLLAWIEKWPEPMLFGGHG